MRVEVGPGTSHTGRAGSRKIYESLFRVETCWAGAGRVGTTLAVELPLVAGGADPLPDKKSLELKRTLKVVVTGGHPGDPEYGCRGTVARYSELGHDVVLLYLNKGEWTDKPGYDPGPARVAEARKACEIFKARPVFAVQIDGRAIVDLDHNEQFRNLLATEHPDVVFTHWPIDNHADHRAISMLVYDAWLRMGRTFALYYFEVSNGEDAVQFTLTHYLDISDVEGRKKARLATPTPARHRTGTVRSRKWSRRCVESKAASDRPRVSSATCKALTSHCRWLHKERHG